MSMAPITPPPRNACGRLKKPTTTEQRLQFESERRERERMETIGVALGQPHRRGAKNPESRRLGYPLGSLFENGFISLEQFTTCERYARVISRWYRLKGLPTGRYDSMLSLMVNGPAGQSHWEPDEDDIAKAERDMADVQCALADHREAVAISSALFNTCVWGLEPNDEQTGNLRLGANILGRLWRDGK